MPDYLEALQLKRDAASAAKTAKASQDTTDKLAKSQDISSLLKQMQEAALASYLTGSNQKSSVVLTDQTDLGDKMVELGDKLSTTVAGMDTSEVNSKQLAALESLADIFTKHQTLSYKNGKEAHKQLLDALKSLKLSPNFTIPEPRVTVTPQKIDFKPLQETIKQYFAHPETEEKIDLECYRAQDIDDSVTDYQYVGFVNPSGNWYIIENDVKGNSLRYVFGQSGYDKAFKKASTYKYLLLNEAVNAL